MSEPIRTSAEKRAKLATALKRNMARRKAAGNAAHSTVDSSPRSAGACPVEGRGREPLAAGGKQRNCVGDKEFPTIKGATS